MKTLTVEPTKAKTSKKLKTGEASKAPIVLRKGDPNHQANGFFAPGHKLGNRWKPGESGNPSGRPTKSSLDRALEEYLDKVILVPGAKRKRGRQRKDIAANILVKALFNQALSGLGKGRIAQLIAERVGGKPTQRIDAEGINDLLDDPKYRRSRIKELQKTLRIKIST